MVHRPFVLRQMLLSRRVWAWLFGSRAARANGDCCSVLPDTLLTQRQDTRQLRSSCWRSWPAISDIWLGIRTVPVLSVAKESRGASQIAHWPRSARTQAGRCGLTDRRSSGKKPLSFVRLLMFPSLLEEFTGHGMPVECSKLTCFAKVKNRHGSRAVRSTIAVGRCQSSFAYSEAEFDLEKGKNRSKATYPH